MAGSTTNPYADPTASAATAAITTPARISQPSSFDNLVRDLGGIFSSTQPGESRKSIIGQGNAAVERIDDYLDYEAPELVNYLTYMLPVIGTMRTLQDATENREMAQEHPGEGYGWRWLGDMGLAALSLIPGLGGVGAGLGKGAIKAAGKGAKVLGKGAKTGAQAAKGLGRSADDIIKIADDAGIVLSDAEKAAVKRAEAGLGRKATAADKLVTRGDMLDTIASKGVGAADGAFKSAGSAQARGQLSDVIEGIVKGQQDVAAAKGEISAIDDALEAFAKGWEKGGKHTNGEYSKLTELLGPEELAQLESKFDRAGGSAGRAERIRSLKSSGDRLAFDASLPTGTVVGKTPVEISELPGLLHQSIADLVKSQGRSDDVLRFLLSPRTRDGKIFKTALPAWAGRGAYAGAAQGISPGTADNSQLYYLQRLMQQLQNGDGMYAYYNPGYQG